MSEERDWGNLPSELIYLISQKLIDLCYFIRFRAVCKSWCSSVLLSDHPPQIPWLLKYDGCIKDGTSFREELCFYSIACPETKARCIPIKESHRSKKYQRPGHGYLLVVDGRKLSLLNPLTNNTISLPSLTSNCSYLWSALDLIPNQHIFLRCGHENWSCGTYHPDKMEWKYINSNFISICYCNGMLFTTARLCCTQVFEAASGKKLYEIPSQKNENSNYVETYLVESCGVVLRLFRFCTRNFGAYIFCIYKLNFEGENGQPSWVKVSDIGNQILFLDVWNGFSIGATAGFKENSIYYIVNRWRNVPFDNIDSTLWRYDIASGTVERVPCPLARFMWFIPKLC